MALTTTKVFQRNLSANDAVFPSVDGEPRMNIEGIVEVAGSSDINVDMTSVSGAYLVGKPAAADPCSAQTLKRYQHEHLL